MKAPNTVDIDSHRSWLATPTAVSTVERTLLARMYYIVAPSFTEFIMPCNSSLSTHSVCVRHRSGWPPQTTFSALADRTQNCFPSSLRGALAAAGCSSSTPPWTAVRASGGLPLCPTPSNCRWAASATALAGAQCRDGVWRLARLSISGGAAGHPPR